MQKPHLIAPSRESEVLTSRISRNWLESQTWPPGSFHFRVTARPKSFSPGCLPELAACTKGFAAHQRRVVEYSQEKKNERQVARRHHDIKGRSDFLGCRDRLLIKATGRLELSFVRLKFS